MATVDSLGRNRVPATLGSAPDAPKVTIRVLSDLDVQRRDEYALLHMARRRRELDDTSSEAYELFLSQIQTEPEDQLRALLLREKEWQLRREASLLFQPSLIPFPDDATDDEKMEVVNQREMETVEIAKKIEEYVAAPLTKYKDEIAEYSRERLIDDSKISQVNAQIRLYHYRAFQDYTVYASTYDDDNCTRKRFKSPDEVAELHPDIRFGLISFYFNKVDTVQPIDLKRFLSMDDSTASLPVSSSPDGKAEKTPNKSHGGGRKRG